MAVFLEETLIQNALWWEKPDSVPVIIKVRWEGGSAYEQNKANDSTGGTGSVFCDRRVEGGGFLLLIGLASGEDAIDISQAIDNPPQDVVGAYRISDAVAIPSLDGSLFIYEATLE